MHNNHEKDIGFSSLASDSLLDSGLDFGQAYSALSFKHLEHLSFILVQLNTDGPEIMGCCGSVGGDLPSLELWFLIEPPPLLHHYALQQDT